MELFDTLWETSDATLTLDRWLFSETGARMFFFKLAMANGWETNISATCWSEKEEEGVREYAIETAKWKAREMRRMEIYSACWNEVHRRLWNGDVSPDRETAQRLSDVLKLIEEETERKHD